MRCLKKHIKLEINVVVGNEWLGVEKENNIIINFYYEWRTLRLYLF